MEKVQKLSGRDLLIFGNLWRKKLLFSSFLKYINTEFPNLASGTNVLRLPHGSYVDHLQLPVWVVVVKVCVVEHGGHLLQPWCQCSRYREDNLHISSSNPIQMLTCLILKLCWIYLDLLILGLHDDCSQSGQSLENLTQCLLQVCVPAKKLLSTMPRTIPHGSHLFGRGKKIKGFVPLEINRLRITITFPSFCPAANIVNSSAGQIEGAREQEKQTTDVFLLCCSRTSLRDSSRHRKRMDGQGLE